ncbi:hypothetical protein DAEQUDRAFT_759830 [Daedalea quercina L-15889]|uniref:Uncharacterized protein n=1 Tax=Daedalea quercina L-15889 TaxID=1314783 RepID=A0A165LLF3_9APHY|nr:hypothetical protein DAEQUDRAFT_759830 [Daedalea quercina L-15889]
MPPHMACLKISSRETPNSLKRHFSVGQYDSHKLPVLRYISKEDQSCPSVERKELCQWVYLTSSTYGVPLAAMKVSSISGSARRVLDIFRHTVGLPLQSRPKAAWTDGVKEVIAPMQNGSTVACLRERSFPVSHSCRLLKCIEREVGDNKFYQHQHCVCTNVSDTYREDNPVRRPAPRELRVIFDPPVASYSLLCPGCTVARRPEDDQRVTLSITRWRTL